jgi:hypothetical protein
MVLARSNRPIHEQTSTNMGNKSIFPYCPYTSLQNFPYETLPPTDAIWSPVVSPVGTTLKACLLAPPPLSVLLPAVQDAAQTTPSDAEPSTPAKEV